MVTNRRDISLTQVQNGKERIIPCETAIRAGHGKREIFLSHGPVLW